MANKKGKKTSSEGELATNGSSQSSTNATSPASTSSSQASTGAASKPTKSRGPEVAPDALPALLICRNKHWRYISSFHGPWLSLPHEILENLAHANWNTPVPRPIDPAVFFDLVKIRKLLSDAEDASLKANTGYQLAGRNDAYGRQGYGQANRLGLGTRQSRLSPELQRRSRIRAVQRLSEAYHRDEIATSVLMMQGSTGLEKVAVPVLKQDPAHADAKYVNFFHEKIPSRQVAEFTSLVPLNELIAADPNDVQFFRTRATVKTVKDDLEGALRDLDEALRIHRWRTQAHESKQAGANGLRSEINGNESQAGELQLASEVQRNARRPVRVVLSEEEQPSSLEQQLLFQRGGIHLAMACKRVPEALSKAHDAESASSSRAETPTSPSSPAGAFSGTAEGALWGDESAVHEQPPVTSPQSQAQAHAYKHVRLYTRKAIRDYMAFLAKFDYSPNVPMSSKENSGSPDREYRVTAPVTVYPISALFKDSPPTDIPPFPSQDMAIYAPREGETPVSRTTEASTYHPLLVEALHNLLLCHALAQTSTKELQRHAYMVARLTRLADGYPVFQASRSPAKSDWSEMLRKTRNWLNLSSDWRTLCAPDRHTSQSSGKGTRADIRGSEASLPNGNARPLLPAPETAACLPAVKNENVPITDDHKQKAQALVSGQDVIDKDSGSSLEPSEASRGAGAATNGDSSSTPIASSKSSVKSDVSKAVTQNGSRAPPSGAKGPPPRPVDMDADDTGSSIYGKHLPGDPEELDRAGLLARWVLEAPASVTVSSGSSSSSGRRKKKLPSRKANGSGLATAPLALPTPLAVNGQQTSSGNA